MVFQNGKDGDVNALPAIVSRAASGNAQGRECATAGQRVLDTNDTTRTNYTNIMKKAFIREIRAIRCFVLLCCFPLVVLSRRARVEHFSLGSTKKPVFIDNHQALCYSFTGFNRAVRSHVCMRFSDCYPTLKNKPSRRTV